MATRSSRPAATGETAYGAALTALARRAHSRAELEAKLARRGHAPEDVEAALARVAEAGYLDDAQFAQALVRRRHSGRGAGAIAAELRAKGISREVASAALAGLEPEDQAASALGLARRSLGPGSSRADVQRVAGRLLRRGYSSEVAWAACRTATEGGAEPGD